MENQRKAVSAGASTGANMAQKGLNDETSFSGVSNLWRCRLRLRKPKENSNA